MENQWLRMNGKKISAVDYQLTELDFKNENPGVPIKVFRGILAGAVAEIKKLQLTIDELSAKLPKGK